MALTKEEVALRLQGLPSFTSRELQQVFEQIIDDIESVESGEASEATTTEAGIVKQAAAQADSTATDATGVVSDLNDLLAKLRTAGILASS